MKFLLVLTFIVAAFTRKAHLKTKGNIDYKPELIEGFHNSDALKAINE